MYLSSSSLSLFCCLSCRAFPGVRPAPPDQRPYSEFLNVRSAGPGNVDVAIIEEDRIRYGEDDKLSFYTISPETDNNTLIGLLDENGVEFSGGEPESREALSARCLSIPSRFCY